MSEPVNYIEYREDGPVTVGTIVNTDMLDGSNVSTFGDQAVAYTTERPGLHLLLSFQNIRYMSSAALTELLRLNQHLQTTGGHVRLCGLNRDIHNVFRITNLEKLFVIHEEEDVESARRRFARALEVAQKEDAWSGPDASD